MGRDRIGPYELRAIVGRGGMGSVFRAWDPRAGRDVAIKVLARTDDQQRRRFQREAEVLASLNHRNVVRVQAAGATDDGHPYLVMDLVDGPSLADVLERDGPLPIRRAVEITWHLAQGLAHAHEQGVLHRDLKPANVLLAEGHRPLLTDFGLAKELDGSRSKLTRSGHSMGTPGYWPPEQARGDRGSVCPASDVYGLGAILYALLTGEPPIDGDTLIELMTATISTPPRPPSDLRREVDPALEAIVLGCLEKDIAKRPPSAEVFADALDAWLLGSGQTGRPLLWPAVAVGGALAATVLIAALSFGEEPAPPAPTPPDPPTEKAPSPALDPAQPEPVGGVRLWNLSPGDSLRYRLIRRTERGQGTQALTIEFVFTQRMVDLRDERALFELDVEELRMSNVQNGIPVLEDDSAAVVNAHQAALHQRVQTLLDSHPRVLLDPSTGRLFELSYVPNLNPPTRERDAATELVAAVLGVVSNQGIFGCLQTLWNVVPPVSPKEPWELGGQVWPAGGVRYSIRRGFKPRGERVVVSGRARGEDAILPRNLHESYEVGDLDLRGKVRFSPRGLESSRMEMRYEVVVGDYPGPRRTTLEFERLD